MSEKIEKFHINQEQEVMKLQKEVAVCHMIIDQIWKALCHKGEAFPGLSTGNLPLLHYPPPSTLWDSAPSLVSATSNVSSTSSGLPVIRTLNLDSPGTWMAALPVAVPSCIGWECTQVQGTLY